MADGSAHSPDCIGNKSVTLEESSKVSGASNLRTLTRVTLPVLRPAILASFILVIVRSLASFAVPSIIGMPGRIYVLATHVYRIIATGFAADFGMAAAVGMSALAASITLIYLYRYLTSESEKYVTVSSRGYRPTLIELNNAKYPLFAIVAAGRGVSRDWRGGCIFNPPFLGKSAQKIEKGLGTLTGGNQVKCDSSGDGGVFLLVRLLAGQPFFLCARTFNELQSRDLEDGLTTGQPQDVGPEAHLNGTSQSATREDALEDAHIRGRSR